MQTYTEVLKEKKRILSFV